MNQSPNSEENESPLRQGRTPPFAGLGVRSTERTAQRHTPLMIENGPKSLPELLPLQLQQGKIILHQKPTNTVVSLVSNMMNGSPRPLGATPYAGGFPPNRTILNSAGRQVMMRKHVAKTPMSPSNSVVCVYNSPTEWASPPRPIKTKSVQMKLRSRANPLPLHSAYFSEKENRVLDNDVDVIFQCGDGGRVKGHKLILASQSKFFTDLFRDQPLGEISIVSIPEIQSGTMKLIILLAYKNSVVLDGEQMENVKEFFDTFGLDFENMNVELNEERSLDVGTDKVQENIQRQSNPDVGQQQKRKMIPSFTSAQLQRLSNLNKISTAVVHPNMNEDKESDFESFQMEDNTSRVLFNHDKQNRNENLYPRLESEAYNNKETNNQSVNLKQTQLQKMMPVKKQYHPHSKLQWLYVCARCDYCSESVVWAQIHFGKCYQDGEALFESTVTKYRQGFYGKNKCPLCPLKYVSNGGFVIHSGHQHQDYRKMFSYIENFEDKLKCNHCQRKFGNPEDFHVHLHHGQKCVQFPIIPQSTNTPAKNDSSSTQKTQTPNSIKKKAGPSLNSVEKKKFTLAKPQRPVIPTFPPPRSARLAKRASDLLMAKVVNYNEESDEEKTPKKKRTFAIDYPPADCPICGASEVANISQHLTNEHEDINVSVNRISTELLRCRKCYITFRICDLISHSANCGNNSQEADLDKTKSSVSTPEPNLKQKRALEKGPIVVPPDLGCSPIDKVEYSLDELKSAEVFQKSLTCPVCDIVGKKRGDISSCLKNHGIFRCTLCLNTYKSKEDYDMHMRACHLSGTRVKCLFCESKTFSNVGQTIAHFYQVHVFLPPTVKKGETLSVSSVVDESKHQPQNPPNADYCRCRNSF